MLIDILKQIAPLTGYNLSDADSRSYLVDVIVNPAAKELYKTYELCNVNDEQVFLLPAGKQVLALPYYVGNVISIRDVDFQRPFEITDMRIRYHDMSIGYPSVFTWREKRKEAPLHTVTNNDGKITLRMSEPSKSNITITITGRTLVASKTSEDVVFAVGDTEHTTVNSFLLEDIDSIRKSNYNEQDIYLYDMVMTEISVIPNCLLKPCYTLYNVQNEYSAMSYQKDRYMEVLFRKAYIPMVKDTDSFVAGDIYDEAIYWKAAEIYYTKRQGEDSVMLADAAYKKCEDLVNKISDANDYNKFRPLPFGSNPVMSAYDKLIIS